MNTTNKQGEDFLYELLALSGGHQSTEAATEISIKKPEREKLGISINEVREEVVNMQLNSAKEYRDTTFITTRSKSPAAQRIFRAHFLSKILPKLDWISKNHVPNRTTCANHISSLFDNILNLFKNNPEDPFSSYMIAIFDGLSHNDSWVNVDRSVYLHILNQAKQLGKKELKDYREVDKAILKLEKMGVSTTPY